MKKSSSRLADALWCSNLFVFSFITVQQVLRGDRFLADWYAGMTVISAYVMYRRAARKGGKRGS